jgi:hypothetical protein
VKPGKGKGKGKGKGGTPPNKDKNTKGGGEKQVERIQRWRKACTVRRFISKPSVTAAVLHLLKNCPFESLAWLTRGEEMYSNLYGVQHDVTDVSIHGSAFTFEFEELPWYVALLLATHSRKHVFESARKLSHLRLLAKRLASLIGDSVGLGTTVHPTTSMSRRW